MEPKQVLQLRVIVDLGVMAMTDTQDSADL